MVDGSVWVGLGALVSINLVVINWVPLVGCAGHGVTEVTRTSHLHGVPEQRVKQLNK